MKKFAVLLMMAAVLLVTSCGKAPQAEIDAAKAAVDAALKAGADVFAPDAFARAKASLAEMEAEVAAQGKKMFKSFDKAKTLALAVRKAADDARAAAEARKTELKNELPKTLAALAEGLKAAQAKLAAALQIPGVRLDTAALKNDADSVQRLLAQAKADLDAGKLADASSKANQARDLLARANKTIDDARAAATVKKR